LAGLYKFRQKIGSHGIPMGLPWAGQGRLPKPMGICSMGVGVKFWNSYGTCRGLIEARLVDDLKPGILIGSEGFKLSFLKRQATIGSCRDIVFPIEIYAKPRRIESVPVYATKRITLPPRSKTAVPILIKKTRSATIWSRPYLRTLPWQR